jgi:hypothetical protein
MRQFETTCVILLKVVDTSKKNLFLQKNSTEKGSHGGKSGSVTTLPLSQKNCPCGFPPKFVPFAADWFFVQPRNDSHDVDDSP